MLSQNEKVFFRVAVLTLAVLTFQACGQGFKASSESSNKSECLDCGMFGPVNFSALPLAIAQVFQTAISNFPGLATLASCESVSACAGTGPSSQTITANCASSGFSLSGSTAITFNGGQCNPLSSSQIVVAPNLTFSASSQTIQLSSASTSDYSGDAYGGGIEVDYNLLNASGSIAIHGLHISGTGYTPIDIESHTTAPITASLNILSLTGTVSGGSLVMADKLSGYTATLTANALQVSTSCACPIGGSLSGTLSGRTSGSISITFNPTCGSITTVANGVSSTIAVAGCSPL